MDLSAEPRLRTLNLNILSSLQIFSFFLHLDKGEEYRERVPKYLLKQDSFNEKNFPFSLTDSMA
jgi:hypothetical protein